MGLAVIIITWEPAAKGAIKWINAIPKRIDTRGFVHAPTQLTFSDAARWESILQIRYARNV